MNDILNILREGSFASGKIFVSDIMEACDVETKETGEGSFIDILLTWLGLFTYDA